LDSATSGRRYQPQVVLDSRLTRSRKAQAGGGVDDACACAFRQRVKRLYGNGFGISHRTKVALSN
jgi:hypothetical protein